MLKRILPSYPIFVKDPYFSIWANNEELNKQDTVFWTGQRCPVLGLVKADGKIYRFMGLLDGVEELEQKDIAVGTFSTSYKFECQLFEMQLDFISPLPPCNLDVLSSPVCYMSYKIVPFQDISDLSVMLIFTQEAVCNNNEDVRGGAITVKNKKTAWCGLAKQRPLSHVGDKIMAEWGYYYVAGDKADYLATSELKKLGVDTSTINTISQDSKNIVAYDEYKNVTGQTDGVIIVAMDGTVSINYFGEWLRGYYFREGKTILDAISEGFENYELVNKELKSIEDNLAKKTAKYGKEYLTILNASFRQVMAGHKLVKNKKGELLYLSKECSSNGCIATTDVSYPSYPMFLLYNPILARSMLTPIFEFARKEVWEYDFAPHDVGIYPYCCGQTYGLNLDNLDNGLGIDWEKMQTFPPIYMLPKGANVYNTLRQMPVEESANIIIMAYAVASVDGDTKQLKENFDLLEKWANYLLENGLFPKDQLCTDDFGGHIKGSINLSAKTIVALEAFSRVCYMLGKNKIGERFGKYALEFAHAWDSLAWDKNKTHTKLSFDDNDHSFSLKYNIAFSLLMDTNLFDKDSLNREFEYYLSKVDKYGVPLDNRNTYTKSDWMIWICLFSKDLEKQKIIIKTLYNYLKQTPNRVPFGDWYDTKSAKQLEFQNRTVQGGLFMLLLAEEQKLLRGKFNG